MTRREAYNRGHALAIKDCGDEPSLGDVVLRSWEAADAQELEDSKYREAFEQGYVDGALVAGDQYAR